jgi:hypothetical protein
VSGPRLRHAPGCRGRQQEHTFVYGQTGAESLRRPITPENARHLVATLIADGGPHALTAAKEIQKGLDRQLYAVGLEAAQRDSVVLSVLEDPPTGSRSSAECLRGISAIACSASACSRSVLWRERTLGMRVHSGGRSPGT